MAIGDNNSSGNTTGANRVYDTQYYSRLRFKEPDSNRSLAFSFRSGLLLIDIQRFQDSNGFRPESEATIYLSPTKARIFADQIEQFKNYYNSGNTVFGKGFGVNAGMGEKVSFIGVHSNPNKDIFITIGKFDNDGNILESSTFTLNTNYHFGLEWEDIKTMGLQRVFYDTLELDQLHDLALDFARSMSGACGYAEADLTRYDTNRIMRRFDNIYDKLGIERRGSQYSNSQRGNNNFLSNSTSTHISADDIEGILN